MEEYQKELLETILNKDQGGFVTNFTLFFQRCNCGQLTVHGFHHQFKWQKTRSEPDATYARPVGLKCDRCETPYNSEFKFIPKVENDTKRSD